MIIFNDRIILGHPIVHLNITSSHDLREQMGNLKKSRMKKSPYLSLAVIEEQCIVRMFSFTDIPTKDLRDVLLAEAIDLLFLPLDEIEIDYQIFRWDHKKIEGIFICAPKSLIKHYLFEMDKAQMIPVRLTVPILHYSNAFLHRHDALKKRFCVLEFNNSKLINLIVFNNKICEFIREIKYDTIEEAKHELLQSLRSACSNSSVKELDMVYYWNDTQDTHEILYAIKATFDTKVSKVNIDDLKDTNHIQNTYFKINLLSKYIFSFWKRNYFLLSTNIIIFVLLMQCIFLSIESFYNMQLMRIYSYSYNQEKIDYAKNLEDQLK